MKLMLLGTPRLAQDGRDLSISRRRVMALLAYLAVTGEAHGRHALVSFFWPDEAEAAARANLRRELSRLKGIVGEAHLHVDRRRVAWNAPPGALDVAAFQLHVERAQNHAHPPADLCPDCLAGLETAVSLYAGDFMAGFNLSGSPAFAEWQFFRRESYRQQLSWALSQLIGWHMARAEWAQGIAYGHRWLEQDELHEPAHQALMKLYAASGETAAALAQYETYARLLQTKLGLSPQVKTMALYETIKIGVRPQPPGTPRPTPAAAPATPLPTPVGLERYQRGELLAVGGHGEVYHGRDRITGEAVAIKRLKPDLVRLNPEVVARFVQEGEALRRLNHPNIVRMLAAFTAEDEHWIVMEFVPGGTLHDLLAQARPLPLERALGIALELADALSRAHHLNIIHRDLKPSNVLLAQDGTPRLTDFGVARLGKQEARLTKPGAFIGSPAYMSPEVLQNERPDARSDIWSFGVMLYEILTGENPFAADRVTAVLLKILNEPVPPLSDLRPDAPPFLADLVARILVKNPAERVPSMRQVAAELEAIRQQRPTPAPPPAAPGSAPLLFTPPPPPPSRLPADPTPLVGREAELQRIEVQLMDEQCRLLTIVAMGGMGKTRLGIAAARRLLAHPDRPFADGVVFVSFVGIDAVEAMPAALVKAMDLRLSGQEDPLTRICHYLQERAMLLVLDNCEQLLAGVDLFNQLLQASPASKLLVTSREPLNIEAEWRLDLEGLAVPPPATATAAAAMQFEAVQLFVQTAQQVQPGFALTAETLPPVVRLCRMVAGMPLALKLAATWLRVMSCERIEAEVARNMDILTSRMRDLPPRQRSMRAVFEQTWGLLTADEQQVFQALAVFRDGFTAVAAEAVIERPHYLLMGLVERGLVQQGENGRYQVHELTRQFAADKLRQSGQETAVIARHAAYFLGHVAGQQTGLHSQEPHRVAASMRRDLENIRAAWEWAVVTRALPLIAPAVAPLATFFELAGLLPEGEQFFELATTGLEKALPAGTGTAVLCQLLVKQAMLGNLRGRFKGLTALLDKAFRLVADLPDQEVVAQVHCLRGRVWSEQGDVERAVTELETAVALLEAGTDAYALIVGLSFLGDALARAQQPDRALACHQRGLAIAAKLGDAREEALALSYMGHAHYYREDYEESLAYFRRANALFEQVDDLLALARTTQNMGHIYGRLGDYEAAIHHARRALPLFEKVGADTSLGTDILGDAYLALGDYDLARTHYERGIEEGLASGKPFVVATCRQCLGRLEMAMGRYEAAETCYREAIAAVEEMQMERHTAVFRGNLGVLYRQMGRYADATRWLDEALERLGKLGNRYHSGGFLIEKAMVAYQQDNFISALALVTAGLELVQEVGRKPAVFDGRLLLAKIRFALGETDEAERQLRALLAETESPPQQAAIQYELWHLGSDQAAAQAAFDLYQTLSARTPNVIYLNRFIELRRATMRRL